MCQRVTIGEAAKKVGINAKTIRYYEGIGLIPRLERQRSFGSTSDGYRLFDRRDLNRLQYIKRARQLDLSLAEVKQLLAATERGSATPTVLSVVDMKLAAIDDRIRDLELLRRSLGELRRQAKAWTGEAEPCCEPVCGPLTCEPDGARQQTGQAHGRIRE